MRARQLIQKSCVLFFILFYWGFAVANTQKVVTLGHKKIVFDQGQISVYKDPSESLTLDDVAALNAQGKFIPTRDAISEGYIRSAVWGHTKISRPEEASRVWGLSITPSYLDRVDIFVLHEGKLIEHLVAGDQVVDSEHDLHSRHHIVEMDFPVGTFDLYFRIKTTSTSLMLFKMIPEAEIIDFIDLNVILEGALIGVLFTMLIINLINSIWLRSSLFLSFFLYEIGIIVTILLSVGLGYIIFPNLDSSDHNTVFKVGIMVTAIMAFLFFYRLIDFYFKGRVLVDLLFLLGILHCCYGIYMTLTGRFVEVMNYLNWFVALFPIAVSVIVLPSWKEFDTEKKFRFSGFIVFGFFTFVNSMYVNGVIGASGLKSLIPPVMIFSFQLTLHFVIMCSIRKSESVLEQAQREASLAARDASAERLQRERDQTFLAMLSHEIRTPLAVIDSATQALIRKNDRTEKDDYNGIRYTRIRDSVKRANELLGMSLIKARSGKNAGTEYDIIELTWSVIKSFDDHDKKRIKFWYPSSKMINSYRVSEGAIHIVMRNLIDNALKYSPIESPVDITVREGKHGLYWSVQDYGPGLNEHVQKHMYEQFFRADERVSVPGLGLGLYVTKQIMEEQGADLVVDSGSNGTIFTCCL